MARSTYYLLLWGLFVPIFLVRLATIRPINLPNNQKMAVEGRITSQPYQKGSKQYFYLRSILVQTDPLPAYFYGQKITFVGNLEREVINRFKIIYIAKKPDIRLIKDRPDGLNLVSLRAWLFSVRQELEDRLKTLLPSPHNQLMLGILLGVRQNLPQEFLQRLINTGKIHLIVASGQNVVFFAGIVIEGSWLVLGRRRAVVLGIMGACFYCLLAGAEAPVVRATLMVCFSYLAVLLGRQADKVIGFTLAVFLMLIVIPLYIFDLGFQLSVAATAGLVFLLPKLENWTEKAKIKLPGLLKEGLLVSLAAQAATLPIIALTFKTFSLSSFVANLLIVPLIPFMLVLSLLALVASMIFLPAGQLFAYLAFPFLDFFILTVNLLSGFSWTNVKF